MGTNRGKDFEDAIKKAFLKEEDIYVLRLYDTTNGFIGIANPCDFVVYKYPIMYLIECKSCHGASLPLSNISDNQWGSLIKASNTPGIIAGYMIWFIDKDITYFITAQDAFMYTTHNNKKSLPYDLTCVKSIKGMKKRIMFDYDMKEFLNGTN